MVNLRPVTPYDQIADLASDIRREGFDGLSDELLGSHRGIFNGTELYIAWRYLVAKIAEERGLSVDTRAKAEALRQMLDKNLS